jgi:hypothetical protein
MMSAKPPIRLTNSINISIGTARSEKTTFGTKKAI